jgi:hypothetical protein
MKTKIPFCSMAALAGLAMALPPAVTARPLPFWHLATPVVEVNSLSTEGCPIESWDGLSIYIASNRPGSLGVPGPTGALPNDIWAADRASKDQPFGELQNLGAPVNSEAADFCPPIRSGYLVRRTPGPGACGAVLVNLDRRNAARGEPEHLGTPGTAVRHHGRGVQPVTGQDACRRSLLSKHGECNMDI